MKYLQKSYEKIQVNPRNISRKLIIYVKETHNVYIKETNKMSRKPM